MKTSTEKIELTQDTCILAEPKFGWSSFKLGDFIGSLSYIDDVPEDILDAIDYYYTHGIAPMVFDEEGTSFTVIIEWDKTTIIINRGEPEIKSYDVDGDAVVETLIRDLYRCREHWADFNYCCEDDPKDNSLRLANALVANRITEAYVKYCSVSSEGLS